MFLFALVYSRPSVPNCRYPPASGFRPRGTARPGDRRRGANEESAHATWCRLACIDSCLRLSDSNAKVGSCPASLRPTSLRQARINPDRQLDSELPHRAAKSGGRGTRARGPTRICTAIAGFRVQSVFCYTTGPGDIVSASARLVQMLSGTPRNQLMGAKLQRTRAYAPRQVSACVDSLYLF